MPLLQGASRRTAVHRTKRRVPWIRRSVRLATIFLLAIPTAHVALAIDGKDLATNGNGNGAHACAACHGVLGEGRPDAAYPRLAGLNAGYLQRQLRDFAEGNRESTIMHPIAKALSQEESDAIANFYAGLVVA